MSYANWFRRQPPARTSPRLEALILHIAQYIQSRPAIDEFRPNIVAKAVSESELAALTGLSILERLGITKQHFGVYCGNTNTLLESYDDLAGISGPWRCEVCDADHSVAENSCKIDIFFTVDRDRLARFIAKTSA